VRARSGKFWEFHDLLFAESPRAAPDDLRRYAGKLGLDATEFDRCLSGGVHRAKVQKDLDEGTRLGVNATRAFFINGRPVSGAQPFEAFARVIDHELARSGTPPGGRQ
jgi:protein-disulfide isomerase